MSFTINTFKPNASQLLYSIVSLSKVAKEHLLGKGKRYEKLLKEITSYDVYDDEGYYPKNGKEVYTKLGLNSNKYKKLLTEIYDDLKELIRNDEKALTIKTYECYFSVSGRDNTHAAFRCQIPYIPNVGDNLQFSFLGAALGDREHTFYLEHILHELTDEKQIIFITLKPGYYSGYAKMMEEKEKYDKHQRWLKRLRWED